MLANTSKESSDKNTNNITNSSKSEVSQDYTEASSSYRSLL